MLIESGRYQIRVEAIIRSKLCLGDDIKVSNWIDLRAITLSRGSCWPAYYLVLHEYYYGIMLLFRRSIISTDAGLIGSWFDPLLVYTFNFNSPWHSANGGPLAYQEKKGGGRREPVAQLYYELLLTDQTIRRGQILMNFWNTKCIMGIRHKLVLIISSALLALVASECTKFEFNENDHEDHVKSTNPYTIIRDMFRVSAVVNCTSQLAGPDRKSCPFHHYSMGLISYPRLENWTYIYDPNALFIDGLHVDAATEAHIYSLVQAANPPNITSANFNATIVMNFTTNPQTEVNIPLNNSGFYVSMPPLICWNGTLSGCKSSDKLEGTRIQACGLQWLDDSQRLLPPGQQQYRGNQVRIQSAANVKFFKAYTDDPSSDPWPTYDELAANATVNSSSVANQTGPGDSKSSASIKEISFVTLMVLISGSAIGNWV
ncbi:hypothetical protein F5Y12DRAFT_765069 [Xylaria sp. FL1777]|nr:hypothetical protein F5Y12DRAFT_765069 [Xylaria sp. FL1777]